MWTGSIRNQTRLVDYRQGAWQDKSRGIHTSTSLLTHHAAVAELWGLDTLEIKDPAETLYSQELEQAALEHFRETVITGQNGSSEVCLPWLEGHNALPENMEAVTKRCAYTATRLLILGRYNNYEAVFNEWVKHPVIEVLPEELKNLAY